ncbi:MAG TPA: SRPBCC family protein [Dehalococcoidia bacterium]|nr:SRPBCC family protein [Dehalococcoidia bacterium]
MKFENKLVLPVERAKLWDFLMDVPQVSSCVPGVNGLTILSDDEYKADMRVKVGPVSLNLDVHSTVEYRDRDKWEAAMRSEAKDRRIGGSARSKTVMRLFDKGDNSTELVLESDVVFMGRLGEFGQPLVRKKTNDMLKEFARNLEARLTAS